MKAEPYLFFEGRCDEAIEFYRKTVGGEVTALMRFKEAPEACPSGSEEKVMHANLRIGDSMVMVSDGMNSGKPTFQGFALSISPADEAEAQRVFTALSDGGQITMPLAKTFFSPSFGMLTDRFGVAWIIVVME
jgi:PhnB protein